MKEAGRLIASGRDSDIFEYGTGLVLRRSRNGRSMVSEARTMDYARQHGYPVPAVEDVSDDGTDLVMARVDGPSMVAVMSRRPWTLRRQAAILADLHRRLHQIPAPSWVPSAPCGDGDRLLHLDLHPLNVIIGHDGPMVIDWSNAARGDGNVDIALAWILIASAAIPFGRVKAAVLGRGRAMVVNSFLQECDLISVRRLVPQVVEWKVTDLNMTDDERRGMRQLAQRVVAS